MVVNLHNNVVGRVRCNINLLVEDGMSQRIKMGGG